MFFTVNPTVWTIGNIVPSHTQCMKEKYDLGLGINSMVGREAKHVFIAKYSKNTNFVSRWEQIFQHQFGLEKGVSTFLMYDLIILAPAHIYPKKSGKFGILLLWVAAGLYI